MTAVWTERMLLDLLRARHSIDRGHGPEYTFLEQVRNDAGFNATRTIDALAVHHHPSKGLALHAYEVKVSRGDWRKELSDPTKAAAFTVHVDYFSVVAPRGVVLPGELPENWGLLEPTKTGVLRATRVALPLRPIRRGFVRRPDPIDRGLVVAMLRAANRTAPLEMVA